MVHCCASDALWLVPALGGVLIALPAFDPAGTLGRVFLLPEGRAGLQVVHDEGARLERRLAVGAGGADEDDRLARRLREPG